MVLSVVKSLKNSYGFSAALSHVILLTFPYLLYSLKYSLNFTFSFYMFTFQRFFNHLFVFQIHLGVFIPFPCSYYWQCYSLVFKHAGKIYFQAAQKAKSILMLLSWRLFLWLFVSRDFPMASCLTCLLSSPLILWFFLSLWSLKLCLCQCFETWAWIQEWPTGIVVASFSIFMSTNKSRKISWACLL